MTNTNNIAGSTSDTKNVMYFFMTNPLPMNLMHGAYWFVIIQKSSAFTSDVYKLASYVQYLFLHL